MAFCMPEIVVEKVISYGIKTLRADKKAFFDLFSQFTQDELNADYGPKYLEDIWLWFSTTKIPIVRAWSLNAQQIPCISIHLANETEDESKASIGDYAGNFDRVGETGTAAFTTMVDVGIHANKAGDHVLWLYYIVSYVLFKHKLMAHRLGLKLHTFSASDYSKDSVKMMENIWTRWIRFRSTTENFWAADPYLDIDAVNIDPAVGLKPAYDIATSRDVDPSMVNTTENRGLTVESPEEDCDHLEDMV